MKQQTDPLALPAGDLRHVITFLERSIVTDVSGAVENWTNYATVRAKIEPFRGSDLIRAGQDVTQSYITVTLRYREDVAQSFRIQAPDGIYYKIEALENILLRNRVLRLTCLALGDTN